MCDKAQPDLGHLVGGCGTCDTGGPVSQAKSTNPYYRTLADASLRHRELVMQRNIINQKLEVLAAIIDSFEG